MPGIGIGIGIPEDLMKSLGAAPPPEVDNLLLETGDNLLLESGDLILLE
jgi:hypothetical protein